jgi:hypothetical protein
MYKNKQVIILYDYVCIEVVSIFMSFVDSPLFSFVGLILFRLIFENVSFHLC